jgi:uncharacterized protein (TIGR00251 family)
LTELFRVDGNRLLLNVKAVPLSSKTEFTGIKDNAFRVRIAASPEDGRANSVLIAFLAEFLGCAKRDIVLKSGEKSRKKTFSLPLSVRQKLEKLVVRERNIPLQGMCTNTQEHI